MIELSGWVALNKPEGVISRKYLNEFNKKLGIKKSGFAGTLDPFASGVLPVAIGRATKTLEYFMEGDKEYNFALKFGVHTDSFDFTGKILEERITNFTKSQIENVLGDFIGIIDQTPPKFSAVKIDGKRAYDLARNDIDFEIKSKKIEIFELELLDFNEKDQEAKLWIRCGKGTYIRALVVQIAEKLSTIATTIALHRKRVGIFDDKNAFSLEKLDFLVHNAKSVEWIFPIDYVLDDIPALQVSQIEVKKLLSGQSLERFSDSDLPKVKLLCNTRIIAIGKLSSNRVFPLKIIEI